MNVDRALRVAGRARRIEPEAGLVGTGGRRLGDCRRLCQQRGERVLARPGAGDDHLGARPRQLRQCRFHCRQQRLRDDDRPRPAVRQHERELAGGQLGVDRDRNDTGLDRAEEGGREVDRVVQAEKNALLRLNAESSHESGKTVHPFGKLRVAIPSVIVDECSLCAASGGEVALDQVGSGVVRRRGLHAPFSSLGLITSIIIPLCSGQDELQQNGRRYLSAIRNGSIWFRRWRR